MIASCQIGSPAKLHHGHEMILHPRSRLSFKTEREDDDEADFYK